MADLTEGARRLRELVEPEFTQDEVAHKVGVSQQSISLWANSKATPSAQNMKKLEQALGIPMQAWAEPPKDEALDESSLDSGIPSGDGKDSAA